MAEKKNPENVPLSVELSDMIKWLAQLQLNYDWNQHMEERMSSLSQDYLHQLELESPPYHDRARIAAELQRCRIERRRAKNAIEVEEPLVKFLTSERGKQMISQLNERIEFFCRRDAGNRTKADGKVSAGAGGSGPYSTLGYREGAAGHLAAIRRRYGLDRFRHYQ